MGWKWKWNAKAGGMLCAAGLLATWLVVAAAWAETATPPQSPNLLHTDPLNLESGVHQAFQHFYNLDYDGALSRFDTILNKHPDDPMAVDYVLLVTIFRELYHLDLLDTTLYAHEGFLTSKRTVNEDPAVRKRIQELIQRAVSLSDQRLKANPADKNALFTRGYARAMSATYIGLVDHSFVSGLHQALQARSDHEHVLQLDPEYADAKMVVGIHLFAVASLPRTLRILVGIAGIGGSKSRGLQYLTDAAEHGVITSVESKTTLSLFLRHDARYQEAIGWAHQLAELYPHNYLFRLEEANLTKDAGDGPKAIAAYRTVLDDAQKKGYFVEPRLQLAWFGLADTLRGQTAIQQAADGYMQAAAQPNCSDWLRRKSQLNAGEMFDLLHERTQAKTQYQLVMNGGGDASQEDAAKHYLKTPYTGR